MRDAPGIKGMSHVGEAVRYGHKLVTGKRVLLTAAGLVVAPVLGLVGAGTYFGKKMKHNHVAY